MHFLIDVPTTSVARERYCEQPADVLYTDKSRKATGVVGWRVGDVPAVVEEKASKVFLRVVHCPENDFYPHAEIRCVAEPDSVTPFKPDKESRLRIRRTMSLLAMLLIEPR
ncbi:MAG: hypothetical protein WD066_09725 [Planctomycetaceae bacterium]